MKETAAFHEYRKQANSFLDRLQFSIIMQVSIQIMSAKKVEDLPEIVDKHQKPKVAMISEAACHWF